MQTRTLRVLTDGDFTNPTRQRGQMISEPATEPLADASGCYATGDLPPQSDIGRIAYAFRKWRGQPAPEWWNDKELGEWTYRDIPGFCKSATLADIAKHNFVLTPGRYVGAEEQEDDGEPFAERFPQLMAELEEHFAEDERLRRRLRESLGGIAGA